jgi:hypothetical protein
VPDIGRKIGAGGGHWCGVGVASVSSWYMGQE